HWFPPLSSGRVSCRPALNVYFGWQPEVVAIPFDGFLQSFVHPVVRRPSEGFARLVARHVLLLNFGARAIFDDRFQVFALHRAQPATHTTHPWEFLSHAEVERLPAELGTLRQAFRDDTIGSGRIFHVEKIADSLAIAANAEPFAIQRGLNHARESAAEIQIAA